MKNCNSTYFNSCNHSIDFYRGTSMIMAGEWTSGQHYLNNDNTIHFISYKGTLLYCIKSHISNVDTMPILLYNNDKIVGIKGNSVWEFVLAGVEGEPIKLRINNENLEVSYNSELTWITIGSVGTRDYDKLENKPSINGVPLDENLTSKELYLVEAISNHSLVPDEEIDKLKTIQEGAQVNPLYLPNPKDLIINGVRYNGTTEVNINITSEGGEIVGTTDYEQLINIPLIENVPLIGNISAEDLGLVKSIPNAGLMTDTEKEKLNSLNNFDPSSLDPTFNTKVDKIVGKGLSTNDFTTIEKNKLATLENFDDNWTNSKTAEVTIGGITKGDNLMGLTLREVLEKMLYPPKINLPYYAAITSRENLTEVYPTPQELIDQTFIVEMVGDYTLMDPKVGNAITFPTEWGELLGVQTWVELTQAWKWDVSGLDTESAENSLKQWPKSTENIEINNISYSYNRYTHIPGRGPARTKFYFKL